MIFCFLNIQITFKKQKKKEYDDEGYNFVNSSCVLLRWIDAYYIIKILIEKKIGLPFLDFCSKSSGNISVSLKVLTLSQYGKGET